MSLWKVLLKFSDGTEKELELSDAKTYFGGYLKIKRSFFNALIKSLKMTKIKREKDLSGVLVAIGPKGFTEYNNKNLSDVKRELKRLVNYVITYLNKFNCIVFLPKHLI